MAWPRSTHEALEGVCVWATPYLQPLCAHWSLGLLPTGLCPAARYSGWWAALGSCFELWLGSCYGSWNSGRHHHASFGGFRKRV